MPLFDVNLPANAGYAFRVLYQIAAFELFEIGPYFNELFGLEPTDPINITFEALGFETTSSVANLGPLIIVLLLYLIILITLALLYTCKRCSCAAKVH